MPINAKTKLGGGGLPKLAAQSEPANAYGQIAVTVPANSSNLLAIDASGRYLFSGVRFLDMDASSGTLFGIRRIQIDGVDIFLSSGLSRSNFATSRDSTSGKDVHVNGQFLVETNIKIWVSTPAANQGTLIAGLYAIE